MFPAMKGYGVSFYIRTSPAVKIRSSCIMAQNRRFRSRGGRRRGIAGAVVPAIVAALASLAVATPAAAAPIKLYDVTVTFYTIQISKVDDSGDCCRSDELELYGALGAYHDYYDSDDFKYLTTEWWKGKVGTANSPTGNCGSWSTCNRHFRAGTYDVATLGAGCNFLIGCSDPYKGGLGRGFWKDQAANPSGGQPRTLKISQLADGDQFHVTSHFYDYDYDWWNANDTLANNNVLRTFHPGYPVFAYVQSSSSHATIKVTYGVTSVCSWNC